MLRYREVSPEEAEKGHRGKGAMNSAIEQAELARRMEEQAKKIVRDKAPEFWEEFKREVESTVKYARETMKLRAGVEEIGIPPPSEGVSLFFGNTGVIFKVETCHVFYSKYDRTIQGLRGDGTSFRFTFHLDEESRVCVMTADRPWPMDVEAAGKYVMEPMVQRIVLACRAD
jgi:hypothetical protein